MFSRLKKTNLRFEMTHSLLQMFDNNRIEEHVQQQQKTTTILVEAITIAHLFKNFVNQNFVARQPKTEDSQSDIQVIDVPCWFTNDPHSFPMKPPAMAWIFSKIFLLIPSTTTSTVT